MPEPVQLNPFSMTAQNQLTDFRPKPVTVEHPSRGSADPEAPEPETPAPREPEFSHEPGHEPVEPVVGPTDEAMRAELQGTATSTFEPDSDIPSL